MFSPSSTLVADEIYFLGIMREDATFGNIPDAASAALRIILPSPPHPAHSLGLVRIVAQDHGRWITFTRRTNANSIGYGLKPWNWSGIL
jgi:hypothetical protein